MYLSIYIYIYIYIYTYIHLYIYSIVSLPGTFANPAPRPTEEEVRNYAEWLGMDPEACYHY